MEAALEHRPPAPPAGPPPPPGLGELDRGRNLDGARAGMQQVFPPDPQSGPHRQHTVLIPGRERHRKELVGPGHPPQSPRREFPLVPVNCGAIPSELLESELFGHERGAFTGAVRSRGGRRLARAVGARGGRAGSTIFLDEIGDMPPPAPGEDPEGVATEHAFERVGGHPPYHPKVDLRIVGRHQPGPGLSGGGGDSTPRGPSIRLNVVPHHRAPPAGAAQPTYRCSASTSWSAWPSEGLELRELHPEVAERLVRYDWPGNVRELENLLERLVVLAGRGHRPRVPAPQALRRDSGSHRRARRGAARPGAARRAA